MGIGPQRRISPSKAGIRTAELPRALTPGFKKENNGGTNVSGREIRQQIAPAQRASGVGQEPCVYALHVKGMATLGEQSQLVLRLKLTEAHCTVEGVLEPDDGFVEEDREGVDEGLVDPCVVEVEELLELALKGGDVVRVLRVPERTRWPHEEPHQEVKEAGQEEDDGEDDDDQEDAWADSVARAQVI